MLVLKGNNIPIEAAIAGTKREKGADAPSTFVIVGL
jgi:hypothetical protein